MSVYGDVRGFFIVFLQTYSNPSHTQIRSYQLTEDLNCCWAVQENMCFFQSAVHEHVCSFQVVCLYSTKLVNISFSIMFLNFKKLVVCEKVKGMI